MRSEFTGRSTGCGQGARTLERQRPGLNLSPPRRQQLLFAHSDGGAT